MKRNMKPIIMVILLLIQRLYVFASSVPLSSGTAEIELKLNESVFYYEIGFSSSEENPDEHIIKEYPLNVGDDGVGHDAGNLFVYWEITGKDFLIELSSTQLVSTDGKTLEMYITWPSKQENSNKIFSNYGVYSGSDTVPISVTTASVAEADIDEYSCNFTLTIRRI